MVKFCMHIKQFINARISNTFIILSISFILLEQKRFYKAMIHIKTSNVMKINKYLCKEKYL